MPCLVDDCDRDAIPDSPVHLCTTHEAMAFAHYLRYVEDEHAAPLPDLPTAPADIGARHGWVYFMRFGDLIKIGWTRTPQQRERALQPDAVLHVQPGTMADERALHLRFAELLVPERGREYFRPAPVLLRYIAHQRSHAAA